METQPLKTGVMHSHDLPEDSPKYLSIQGRNVFSVLDNKLCHARPSGGPTAFLQSCLQVRLYLGWRIWPQSTYLCVGFTLPNVTLQWVRNSILLLLQCEPLFTRASQCWIQKCAFFSKEELDVLGSQMVCIFTKHIVSLCLLCPFTRNKLLCIPYYTQME